MIESKIIKAHKDNWASIAKILLNQGVVTPENNFDYKKYVNSDNGINNLDINNLTRLSVNKKILTLCIILNALGLEPIVQEGYIDISSTNTTDEDQYIFRQMSKYNNNSNKIKTKSFSTTEMVEEA